MTNGQISQNGILNSLTVYKIRDIVGGIRVTDFQQAIKDDIDVTEYEVTGNYDFETKLYVSPSNVRVPPWVHFLEPGFGEIDEVLESVSNSAILFVKIRYRNKDRYYAIPFGLGRFILKPNSYERKYGLRTALNIIYHEYDPTGENFSRVSSVDSKTVAANTMHTRRQADLRDAFEAFGIDVQRDLLNAVTGQPMDTNKWGTRVTGADAIRINKKTELNGLGNLCLQIAREHWRKDYQDRFSWVDDIHTVTEPDLRSTLEDLLIQKLINRDVETLELAPPELINWDEIDHFKFSIKQDTEIQDLTINDYLDILEGDEKLENLTIKQLRQSHRLYCVTSDQLIYPWPVFRCISGELKFENKTYLINGGDFFNVAEGYIGQLNDFIMDLQESDFNLINSEGEMKEGDYNEDAANNDDECLLLDKKTVRLSTRTSPIEICDILTTRGDFIHVKRKLGSSSLSHLFAQGNVSGDLFLMSKDYREATLNKIQDAEAERAQDTNDNSFNGKFSTFDVNRISASDYTVVYAIIAKWNGRSFVEALPFFSKVNLRRHVIDLRRMGYNIRYKRINIV